MRPSDFHGAALRERGENAKEKKRGDGGVCEVRQIGNNKELRGAGTASVKPFIACTADAAAAGSTYSIKPNPLCFPTPFSGLGMNLQERMGPSV